MSHLSRWSRFLGLGASLAVLLSACTISPRPTLPVDVLLTPAVLPTPAMNGESAPMLPPSVENGATIYAEKCAACHGESGAGDGLKPKPSAPKGGRCPAWLTLHAHALPSPVSGIRSSPSGACKT